MRIGYVYKKDMKPTEVANEKLCEHSAVNIIQSPDGGGGRWMMLVRWRTGKPGTVSPFKLSAANTLRAMLNHNWKMRYSFREERGMFLAYTSRENTHLFYRWINNYSFEQTQPSSSMQCYCLRFHHKQNIVRVTTNGKILGLDISKTTSCCSQTLGLSWFSAQALFVQHLAQWEFVLGWKPPCVPTEKYPYGLEYPRCSFLIDGWRWKHYMCF